MRVHLSEEKIEIRLTPLEKALGLLAFAVRDHDALERVTVSTPDAYELAQRLKG